MKVVSVFLLLIITSFVLAQGGQEADLSLRVFKDGEWKLRASNHTFAPIHFYIKDSKSQRFEKEVIIPSKDSLVVYDLGVGEKMKLIDSFNKTYDIGYYLGDSSAIHDDNYLYSLPFKKGKKYMVSQGFNGSFSHTSIISRYAIDFQLEVGEAVHAAREGRVVKVEEHFTEHGDEAYRFKANRIIILHTDGTTASYVHLDTNGALVEEGEWVRKGQHIGYSGFTGYTRGPHLHFVVRKGRDQAVPVFFEGYGGKILKKRKKYKRER